MRSVDQAAAGPGVSMCRLSMPAGDLVTKCVSTHSSLRSSRPALRAMNSDDDMIPCSCSIASSQSASMSPTHARPVSERCHRPPALYAKKGSDCFSPRI